MKPWAVPVRRTFCTLALCSANAQAQTGEDLFEKFEIDTGASAYQTILTGSFTHAESAELAVVDSPDGRAARLTILRFAGGQWSEVREAKLADDVRFIGTVRRLGRDHVILYRRGGVTLFDADASEACCRIAFGTHFQSMKGTNPLPRLDISPDLNGDGLDDLIVPDTDGFWISTQVKGGSFARPVKLGPEEPHLESRMPGAAHTYGETGITPETLPWYLLRVHRIDYDSDGRSDLLFWNRDHFELHRQDALGGFSITPETINIDVAFDFDGAYALGFEFEDASAASLLLGLQGRFDYRVLHGFCDLNGDAVADLVTLRLAGRRVFSARGLLNVHFGRRSEGATKFQPDPDLTLEPPGPAGGLAFGYATLRYLDIDSDGSDEIAMASVATGLGGMLRALVGNSVRLDLGLYRLRDHSNSTQADVVRRIRPAFSPLGKRGVLFPTVLLGDVNGDGRADLSTGERWDRLSVFLGVPGPEVFTTQAIHVAVPLPRDERNAIITDINKDGRDDIVIHHPSHTEANRVNVLMALPG